MTSFCKLFIAKNFLYNRTRGAPVGGAADSVEHGPRRGSSSGQGAAGTTMIRVESPTVKRDNGTVANPPGGSRTRKRKRLPNVSRRLILMKY